jgi:thiamine-monophosphate kinase
MEFDLIAYIKSRVKDDPSVSVSIGDDAAILNIENNKQLVVSTDTLLAGRHFDESISTEQLGHKSLAVNLSDIAAMGATPKWVTLNLTLANADMNWLQAFITGFLKLASQYNVILVGGDITQGNEISITATVFGMVDKGQYLTRSAAKRGDLIAVTGELGSAAFVQKNRQHQKLLKHLYTPMPQLLIAQQIKDFAHACIDISDGLLADLGHICSQSLLSAQISLDDIPVNKIVKQATPQWSDFVLSGGDDYQLCFTFAIDDLHRLPAHCSVIGQMSCGQGVKVMANGKQLRLNHKGFIHFNNC